jgi:RNA polymerase sigma factor (sigma-70 family)
MTNARTSIILQHIRRLAGTRHADPSLDGQLLERFTGQHDEAAFAALEQRHGPMVLNVCRSVLRHEQDAEDAYQATFLVLAQKADSIRKPEAVAGWLYEVAYHVAVQAQAAAARRRALERRAAPLAPADPTLDMTLRDVQRVMHEELRRLPDKYRLPLVLCYLEGRSHQEAARQLGWTAASVRGRLERGRARLRDRLVRRGLGLGVSLLALENLTTATVSAALRQATVHQALTFAARSVEGIATNVVALAESGAMSMTMTRAKVGLILLLVLGLAGGAGVLAYPLPSEKQAQEKQTTAAQTQVRRAETVNPASNKSAPTDLYGDPLPSGAMARLGTVRFRHSSVIYDLRVSPDGRTLISAGGNSVEVWDAQTEVRLRSFPFDSLYVYGTELTPDGKLLGVFEGLPEKKMRFWDLVRGVEVHPFGEAAPQAMRAALSPNGELLASLDRLQSQTVNIWDMRKGKKIRTIEEVDAPASVVRNLAFSPNGQLLVFPNASGFGVWDLAAGKKLYQLDLGAKVRPGCAVFSSDSKLLAGATSGNPPNHDHTLHLWDLATGKEIGALKGHESYVTALAVAPKGNVLASASRDGTIRFWDLATRRETSRHWTSSMTYALAFDQDGRTMLSGYTNGVIRRWRVEKGREDHTPAEPADAPDWVAFAPNGQTLITTGEGKIGLWEPLTGQPRQFVDAPLPPSTLKTLSPDGKMLALSESYQGQILLWDVATGKLVSRLGEAGQLGGSSSCRFSPDGQRLVTGSLQGDTVRIWEAASGKELIRLKGQTKPGSFAFSPDGKALVSASSGQPRGDYTVCLWDLATGKEIWRRSTRPWVTMDLAISPDGRTLALGGELSGRSNRSGEVHLWEAATGKELRRWEGHRNRVHSVTFSPDGRMLATGGLDKTIRLWEVATGGERRRFQNAKMSFTVVSFSPDGRLLASAGYLDASALVWDVTGRFRDGRFQAQRLSAKELNCCWDDLAHADAARAYQCIIALSGSPKESVALLKDRLPPVTVADPKRVAPLLAALDSDQFTERDKAATELEKLGLAVEPALREALSAKPALELRRIEVILDKLASGPRLRFLRALEVLEHVGTPEARLLLESLCQGRAELWPTQEAKASLERLARRR